MKPSRFGRVLLPFITPFDRNGDVFYENFARLINYAIDKNFLDTVIVTGTTGEFNTLSKEERIGLYKTAVKAVNGRYPIIAGTGAASTRETIELTRAATEAGINTVMIVGPYYAKPTQRGIFNHYMEVLNNTTADIMIYNIPIFTGMNIEPETVGKLAAASKRFIGIKDESGVNPVQIIDYEYQVKDVNPDFLIYNGDDIMLMPTLACGAHGIVSGGSLLIGDKIRKVFSCFEEGKNGEALRQYHYAYKLCRLFGINGRIHPNPMLRAAVEMVSGIEIGPARMPLDQPTAEEKEAIKKALAEMQLI